MTHEMDLLSDTIVAPATPAGKGAIAIVRLSGPSSREILARIFRTKAGHALTHCDSHRLYYGKVVAPGTGAVLDEGLVVFMKAPHSFTGEDVIEFHLHGSQAVVRSVVEACVACGARPAQPGEFSLRAFRNGKLDLAQAEAIADLIASQTELSQRLALQQLSGGLSQRIHILREKLLDAIAELEAWIDFPEEDIPPPRLQQHETMLREIANSIAALLKTYRGGRIALEGARVVLIGAPNAGKSSLFNALVGRERAIVTPHPGTTRDTIESTIDVLGLPLTLVDTAGIRDSADEIERVGIERSLQEARQAELVLGVIDASSTEENVVEASLARERAVPKRLIAVINKIDLVGPEKITHLRHTLEERGVGCIAVSCLQRVGLDELEQVLFERLTEGASLQGEVCITNERHAQCLKAAAGALERALSGLMSGVSIEFVSTDAREALNALDAILGLDASEEVLSRIFSRFCIGK